MTAEEKITTLGLNLAAAAAPLANSVPAVRSGNLVSLSGQVPVQEDGTRVTGKVGADLDVDQAYAAARLCAVALLARLKAEIGSLNRVVRIVKVNGYVNAVPDFGQQPAVVNGASDLLVEVFGDSGRHARAAVGVASLPSGVAVEIEMIAEVES